MSACNVITPPKASRVCAILASAREYRLRGWWDGSTYRNHPCGVVREGLIFTNNWHVDDLCSIEVMLDPKSPPAPRSHDSWARGAGPSAYYKPARGGVLRIYYTGSWSDDDGPWRAKAVRILRELEDEIALAREAKRLKEREERWIKHDARQQVVERARRVVGGVL